MRRRRVRVRKVRTPREGPTLSALPDDVWLKVAAYLKPRDRANLAATAGKFRYAMDYGVLVFNVVFGEFRINIPEERIAHAVSFARFLSIPRPRFWREVRIRWFQGFSELLPNWLTQPQFSCMRQLTLKNATVHVKDLSALPQVVKLCLDSCDLVVHTSKDPWPLLSSGSCSLCFLELLQCRFQIPDELLCITTPLLEVDLPCLRSLSGYCLFWLAVHDMDYLFDQRGVLPFRFKGGLPPSTCRIIGLFPRKDEREYIVHEGKKTRWPPHVLEEGSNLPPEACLPNLWALAHPCLRGDCPLPSSLVHLRVAVARPWEFLDRVILLSMRGELPLLLALRLTSLDESRPWVPPQQLSNLSRLQNLRMLILPPFKADYKPLLEAINQLTGLTRLGLMLPALGPLPDPAPLIRLDLPELAQLTVDVQVGKVDARGCPNLLECRQPQHPAAAVADAPFGLEDFWVDKFATEPGPYESSEEDGLLLPRKGWWEYGDWIHGSWMYKDEEPGWFWYAKIKVGDGDAGDSDSEDNDSD